MKTIISIIFLIIVNLLICNSCDDTPKCLSGGYCFSSDNLSLHPYPTIFDEGIFRKITDYNYNDTCIVLEQKPELNYYKLMVGEYIGIRYRVLKNYKNRNDLLPGEYEFYTNEFSKDSLLYNRMEKLGVTNSKTGNDIAICEFLADSIIFNNPFYQNIFSREINYWIIKHFVKKKYFYQKSSIVYGPYSKIEYLKKRKELNIPEELKLSFE